MIGEHLDITSNRFRRLELEECVSTNASCLEIAFDGDPGNLWVTAKRQTGGRGTRGRSWDGGTGNLLASLLLIDPSPPERMAELAFVSAVAARNAISELAGDETTISLKWPNDVLLSGRKCGGILLESRQHRSATIVIIGFGINCRNFPENVTYPATSLTREGIDVEAQQVFLLLAKSMAKMLDIWERGDSFGVIRTLWLEHAHGLGEDIKVAVPGKEMIEGRFSGIDSAGHLCVETKTGDILEIPAADIFFGALPENRN